jgi:hypothetical protein
MSQHCFNLLEGVISRENCLIGITSISRTTDNLLSLLFFYSGTVIFSTSSTLPSFDAPFDPSTF